MGERRGRTHPTGGGRAQKERGRGKKEDRSREEEKKGRGGEERGGEDRGRKGKIKARDAGVAGEDESRGRRRKRQDEDEGDVGIGPVGRSQFLRGTSQSHRRRKEAKEGRRGEASHLVRR